MLGGLFAVYAIKLFERVTKITSEKTGKKRRGGNDFNQPLQMALYRFLLDYHF